MEDERIELYPTQDVDFKFVVRRRRDRTQDLIELEGLPNCGHSMGDINASDILCERQVARIIRNRTEVIKFTGEDALLSLPQSCWDKLRCITLDLKCDNVRKHLDKMRKCKWLHLTTNFSTRAEHLIDAMSSVEYLYYDGNIKTSQKLFPMMIEKSLLGDGLHHLEFKRRNVFVRPRIFCEFLAGVKLPPPGKITTIKGVSILGHKRAFEKCLVKEGIIASLHDNGNHIIKRGDNTIHVHIS